MKITINLIIAIILITATAYSFTFPTITKKNPAIVNLMNQVNIDSLESYIRYLQNLGPRPAIGKYLGAPLMSYQNNVDAKLWIYQKQNNNSGIEVHLNHFLSESQCISIDDDWIMDTMRNVVSVQWGTEFPDEYIIVCAHFDTGPYSSFNVVFISPGADDNASGSAGVLELSRVLSSQKFKRTIIYLNTNGEESGWLIGASGAERFADCCRKNDMNIVGVFNLDMIGYNPIDVPLNIFYNDRPTINKDFAAFFSEVSNIYLPEIPALPCSRCYESGIGDCFFFIRNDYPAMYMGDPLGPSGLWQYCYHDSCDTIGIGLKMAGVNSMELVKGYTQATLVAIAEIAELHNSNITHTTHFYWEITPNPTNGDATISVYLDTASNLDISLFNILGQEVLSVHSGLLETDIFTKTLQISTFPIGVYFLKIVHNGSVELVKIVKI